MEAPNSNAKETVENDDEKQLVEFFPDIDKKYLTLTRNPHCQQSQKLLFLGKDSFSRYLDYNSGQKLSYRRRKGELKTVLHWGQRKLLMSEIEFLTDYGRVDHKILYVGAAPGTHIRFLSDLFPDYYWHLYDPSNFVCKETDKIAITQAYFTDEVCKSFEGQKLLFISDIRSVNFREESKSDQISDEAVKGDMRMQQEWHTALKPLKSMLKFRLSYFPGKYSHEKLD